MPNAEPTPEQIKEQVDFGIRVAKVFDSLRDSHVFFYLQKAFPEYADEWEWSDYQKLLDRLLGR